jgi:poly(hydroxyalkanoate) depolymerase family esterase
MLDAWTSFALSPWNDTAFGMPLRGAVPQKNGKFISRYFQHGYTSLRYKLFIPSSYRGQAMPLVVMLHGCGQDADDFALGTGMNGLAEEFGCLVAYPEQTSDANWNRCWNWHQQSHQRDEGEPALLAGLTKQVLAEYAVDRRRVYVAGLSSGGAMAVILGRTYPDLFAAVGCHSGLAHGSATDSYGAMLAMRKGTGSSDLSATTGMGNVPLIVFHGDLDTTVHPDNGLAVVQQSLASYAACYPQEVQAVADSEETGEIRGRRFTRTIHRGKAGNVVVEHWTVHGTGHAWSGGTRHGRYADTQGPNAGEMMLRFFLGR